MATDNETKSRPEPVEKSTPVTRAREARDDANNRIMYETINGQQISRRVSDIESIDEVAPSGVFDVPQGSKEDVEGIPIVVLDAQRRDGKYGPWFIAHCCYLEDLRDPQIGATAERFTVPFNGTVLPEKLGKVMGIDWLSGTAIPGKVSRLPVAGKLVQIEGDDNPYWDFRAPDWQGDAPKAEKPRLVPRKR